MNKDEEHREKDWLINSENDKDKERQGLKKWLKEYALQIICLYEKLSKHGAVHIISRLILSSETSPEVSRIQSF